MSIKHFIRETEKGLRSPAYFLYADDPYVLKEASRAAAKEVPEDERDFSFHVFDLDGVEETPSLEQIVDVLNTVPFMGEKRMVVIENLQELPKKGMEPLENYIENPSPSAVLILLHKGAPKAQFRDVMKKVKAMSLDIRPQDLSLWVREKALQKGLEMTDEAVEYLLGAAGPDVGIISAELEKFSLIGKSRVEARDIRGIVRGSIDCDVFDLVDALGKRDADMVFRVARSLQETHEPYGLLGAINWHYNRMYARDTARAAHYDRVFELLNEADLRIKTSGGTYPLEYLLVRLLRV